MDETDYEIRILAIEQLLREIKAQVAGFQIRKTAAEQSTSQNWGTSGFQQPVAAPVSGCTNDFNTGYVPCCVPTTLTLNDDQYGDFVLTYDSNNLWWQGCKQVTYPGTIQCPGPVSFPLTYFLYGNWTTGNWKLEVRWSHTNDISGNSCPTPGKVCGDATNSTRNSIATFHCSGTSTWSISRASQGSPYTGPGFATLTIVLP